MADPQNTRKPLLSLSTFVERQSVTIDDHVYEIRNGEELSPLQYAHVNRAGRRLSEIEDEAEVAKTGTLEKLSDERAVEFDDLYRQICFEVLIAPDDLQFRLMYQQRRTIVGIFLGRSSAVSPTGSAAPRASAPPEIGAKPLPGSPGSTQASRRKRG